MVKQTAQQKDQLEKIAFKLYGASRFDARELVTFCEGAGHTVVMNTTGKKRAPKMATYIDGEEGEKEGKAFFFSEEDSRAL